MSTRGVSTSDDAVVWWKGRRRIFNWGLAISGFVALVSEALIIHLKTFPADAEVEMTLFTLAFQGAGYALFMLVANVLYTVGRWLEGIIPSNARPRYRAVAFSSGCAFAWIIPQLEPLALLIRY